MNITRVIIAHRPETISKAERIVVLGNPSVTGILQRSNAGDGLVRAG